MSKLNKKGWILLVIAVLVIGFFAFYSYDNVQKQQQVNTATLKAETTSGEYIKSIMGLYHAMYSKYPSNIEELKKGLQEGLIKYNKPYDKNAVERTLNFLSSKEFEYYVRESDYQAYKFTYKSIDGEIKTVQEDYKADLQKTN